MRLEPDRVEVVVESEGRGRLTFSGPVADGATVVGPLEIELRGLRGIGGEGASVGASSDLGSIRWTVANRDDRAVAVRSIAIVFLVSDAPDPLRLFRHGYQSWSPSGVAVFGIDRDPSHAHGSRTMARSAQHADADVALEDELRSEWVTVLQAGTSGTVLVGFDGGDRHDGTLRLRPRAGGAELSVEAHLGGAALAVGERRVLHDVVSGAAAGGGDGPGPSELLEAWADHVARLGSARNRAPYQVGWCSWYHYFHEVAEADLRSNLARAGDWPFDVFQLDDGYQRAIGDWLDTNERFPSSVDVLAAAIAAEGRTPGLWIAPFIVAPDSEVATRHPDWLARRPSGEPLPGMFNPPWEGGRGGVMWALDTTHPEVGAHLESVARDLVDAGYRYLKLDFTFAPSIDGVWADASATPAQRVRAGYEAVRRGAGDDTFVLGCGVPLSNVVGVVDANRIGADVAPSWLRTSDQEGLAGYEDALPATAHAAHATLARAFMHRRLWVNDPDCLMLRTDQTDLSAEAAASWQHVVALSGGMALVSDDLGLLDATARRRLDDVVALGRQSDAASLDGDTPRCDDLMRHRDPRELTATDRHLALDAVTGRSTLRRI